MDSFEDRLSWLAEIMDEFNLDQARWKGEEWMVELNRRGPVGSERRPFVAAGSASPARIESPAPRPARRSSKPKVETAVSNGTPVSSPMAGIFYASPSPDADPFVQEGDTVEEGQTVGLIEAMKTFNEIVAPCAGTIRGIQVENGKLVQPGAPMMFIE